MPLGISDRNNSHLNSPLVLTRQIKNSVRHQWAGKATDQMNQSISKSVKFAKFGLTFLKIWHLLHHIHLENNKKTSCYLARVSVDLRFSCLSHYEILCWCHFSVLSTSTVAHPTPCTWACFPHCFLLSSCFTWHWLGAFLLLVKRLQSKFSLCYQQGWLQTWPRWSFANLYDSTRYD